MTYLHDLEKIVNINSHTKNKTGIDKVGDIISSYLKELGFKTIVYERETIGNHYLHKSKTRAGYIKILLVGHNDTVFAPNTFEGFSQDDEWVYGPGVCDMKGGNIVAIEALRKIYKKNKEIFNVDFLIVSDEETGSDDSKHISSEIAKDYDYCFVFEAAGKNMELVNERKGVGTFEIKITGKAAHAGTSYEKGIDSNLEASYKIQELNKLSDFTLGTCVNIGKINGGIGANTVSPFSNLLIEIRYKINSEKKRVLKLIKEIVNKSYVKGTISSLHGAIQRDVMQKSVNQNNLVKDIEKIIKKKILLESRGGVSDANNISSLGIATLDGFGPFGDGDHTKKERALKKSFEERIKLVSTILDYYQTREKRIYCEK